MHAPEWIALISPGLVLAGAGYAAVARLTRIMLALEGLGRDISAIVKRVDGHENRIGALERNARGRHRAR